MKKRKFLMIKSISLLFLLCCAFQVFAQKKVSGTVTDAGSGMPLPGVNILVTGTSVGTVSDIDGNYTMSIPEGLNSLQFSYVGYITEEIEVNEQTTINVALREDLAELEEVVVIGYGTMKRSDLTGSVVSAKTEDLKTVKSSNVLESLQGKMPGVSIGTSSGRTGSGVDISIRGERSLNASNSPLIIVDGIPYGESIDLNPEEIESVEILKDAASTAIYGARGANGVILITTKKGQKGKANVYFNMYRGISQPTQRLPLMDRDQYIRAAEDALRISLWKDGADWESTAGQNYINFLRDVREQEGYVNGTNTDWQEFILKNGMQADYLLGIRGGGEKVTYNSSLDYYQEEGVVLNDQFNRVTFKLNVDAEVSKRISVGASTILSHRRRDGMDVSFGDAMDLISLVSPYDANGVAQYRPYVTKPRVNPSVTAKKDIRELTTTRSFSTAYANIDIMEGLTLRSNLGVDVRDESDGRMQPPKDEQESQVHTDIKLDKDWDYTWSNVLNYQKDFGVHGLNLMIGDEIRYTRLVEFRVIGDGQPFDSKLWYSLGDIPQSFLSSSSDYEKYTLASVFYRLNYNYNDLVILNLSGRHDGASQLALGYKWAFFPSASAALRLSNFGSLKNIGSLSDLKLRISYGQSGNASVDPYQTKSLLSNLLQYEFGAPGNESVAQGYRSADNIPDAQMTWEKATSYNVGLDVGLFDNKIYANLDAYNTITSGSLLPDRMPLTSGFDQVLKNIGKTRSWGFEGLLKTILVSTNDFNWTTNLTFSSSKNMVLELSEGIFEDRSNEWIIGQPFFQHTISDAGDQWMIYEFDGIWQETPEDSMLMAQFNSTGSSFTAGEIKIVDKNKDGAITIEDEVLYHNRPKWYGRLKVVSKYF